MTTEHTELGERIADLASSDGVTIAVAESLTSGAIASALGASPQAGDWFAGGVVAYSEHVKFDVLGVTPGPVITPECAGQMASGVGRLLSADLVAAVTGAGGPGPQEGREAGTVFLAHGRPDAPRVEELHFDGEPEEVVTATVEAALDAVRRDLEELRG
ncbi:CinA family protein [Leifsonia shinshuensis]|uniref:CinA family protein n=1 Tax=Leifsonia shinshuensis TaxID=150026 RepID=UPI0028548B53|nr:CinA family protein [Leifsonia shinshuensis]MDR6972137.1 nicotinamide-nucleotide amidase [Leifsonia shinshuensis]